MRDLHIRWTPYRMKWGKFFARFHSGFAIGPFTIWWSDD